MQQVTNVGVFTQQTRDIINANFAAAGLGPTQGNIYWVIPQGSTQGLDSDSRNGLSPQQAFKTLSYALSRATAGQNDVVLLCAESNTASATTDYQTANLNWSKNLVHLIGVNGGPLLGHRSRVAPNGSTASFANLFTVSGNGCLIANIEFFQGTGTTNPSAASTCVTVSGQRNVFRNCQISGIGHSNLDDAGSNSLTITGAENLFQHCYIGLDTTIRATSVTEVVMSGSPTRNAFEDCFFATYTSGSTFKLVSIGTGMDRWTLFNRCIFYAAANISSATAPTGALGVTTVNGMVIVKDCGFYGITQITTADNAYVQVLGLDGTATGHLISISQGVDAA